MDVAERVEEAAPPVRYSPRTGRRLPSTAWSAGGPSPNPKGRTPRTHSFTQALHAKAEEQRDAILTRLVDDAVAGKHEALRMLLERMTPANKATFQAVHIPGLAEAQTLKEKVLAVQHAMATGVLSADHAATVIASLRDAEMALQVESLREELQRLRAELVIEADPA